MDSGVDRALAGVIAPADAVRRASGRRTLRFRGCPASVAGARRLCLCRPSAARSIPRAGVVRRFR